jgi:hypothetical protein
LTTKTRLIKNVAVAASTASAVADCLDR